jgi:hypothetical protein
LQAHLDQLELHLQQMPGDSAGLPAQSFSAERQAPPEPASQPDPATQHASSLQHLQAFMAQLRLSDPLRVRTSLRVTRSPVFGSVVRSATFHAGSGGIFFHVHEARIMCCRVQDLHFVVADNHALQLKQLVRDCCTSQAQAHHMSASAKAQHSRLLGASDDKNPWADFVQLCAPRSIFGTGTPILFPWSAFVH